MAATKLSGLTELLGAEVASDDLVYVADTSATASKKMELAQFGGLFLLDEITNVVAGEFDFLAIPQQFNRLWIIGQLRADNSATEHSPYCYFNNDRVATNYWYQQLVGSNNAASASEVAAPNTGAIAANTALANSYGNLKLWFENYAGSNLKRHYGETSVYRANGTDCGVYFTSSYHDSMTAAITRLTIANQSSPTFGLVGTLRLYGEF